jgi:hypothetical protein
VPGYTHQPLSSSLPRALLLICLIPALGLGSLGAAPQGDPLEFGSVPAALASLRDPNRATRTQAQTWLDERLLPEHARVVAQALGDGAETERRLALILGGSDRHFALAARLLVSSTAPGQALAREVLVHRYVAWNRGGARAPRSWSGVQAGLVEPPGPPVEIDVTHAPLLEVIDQLDRLGGAPVPLLMDPTRSLRAPLRSSQGSRMFGTWAEVVASIALQTKSRWVLLPAAGSGLEILGPGAMLMMVHDDQELAHPSAEILVDWISLVQRLHDPKSNRVAAMALGRSGWPVALAWLGEIFAADPKSPVLDALLDAAGRGYWCPSLERKDAILGVLAALDEGIALGGAGDVLRAGRLARAMREMGSMTREGLTLVPDLAADLSTWSDLGQWVRLDALSAMASPLGPGPDQTNLVAVARAALARPGHPARRLAALTWSTRLGAPKASSLEPLPDPWPLLTWATRSASAYHVPSALVSQGWQPPAGIWPAEGVSKGARVLCVSWLLRLRDVERALEALPDDEDAIVLMMGQVLDGLRQAGQEDTRLGFLKGLRAAGHGQAAGHLSLLPGPDFNRAFGEQLLAMEAKKRTDQDWHSLGTLARGGPLGGQARELLVEAMGDEDLRVQAVGPVQEAWFGMLGERRDILADEFMARVELALGSSPQIRGGSFRDIVDRAGIRPLSLANRDVAWPQN